MVELNQFDLGNVLMNVERIKQARLENQGLTARNTLMAEQTSPEVLEIARKERLRKWNADVLEDQRKALPFITLEGYQAHKEKSIQEGVRPDLFPPIEYFMQSDLSKTTMIPDPQKFEHWKIGIVNGLNTFSKNSVKVGTMQPLIITKPDGSVVKIFQRFNGKQDEYGEPVWEDVPGAESPVEDKAEKTVETDRGLMQWNPETKKYDIFVGKGKPRAATSSSTSDQGRLGDLKAIDDYIKENLIPLDKATGKRMDMAKLTEDEKAKIEHFRILAEDNLVKKKMTRGRAFSQARIDYDKLITPPLPPQLSETLNAPTQGLNPLAPPPPATTPGLPNAADYPGKFAKDPTTGIRYQSNGVTWLRVQ